jgi:hypothetical protein
MNWIRQSKAFDWFISIVITLVILNVVAYFVMKYTFGINVYDGPAYEVFRKSLIKNDDDASIPHPYIGKIVFGGEVFKSALSSEPLFDRVYHSKSKDDIKVLILGGSMARHMSWRKEIGVDNLFAQRLNEYFKTDRFSVYSAAFGGCKEPQQYLKMVYLDLLGFRPDIVINYDGFNEIALPLAENKLIDNPAIFPRLYSAHMESAVSRSCVKVNNALLSVDSKIPVVDLATYVFAKNCESKINGRHSPPWWGSKFSNGDSDAYARQSYEIWKESSNRLYEFTKVRGIDYIHVLQPNQFYPDSKVFTHEEISGALVPSVYTEPIRKYYHLLRRDDLQTGNFLDQRYLFKNNTESLYIDNCCHLNKRGMGYVIDDVIAKFSGVFLRHLRDNATHLPANAVTAGH